MVSWGDIPDWSEAVAKSLMLAVRAKDPETFSHCVRVGQMSKQLAHAAGLNEYEQKIAEYAGTFHDIGKIAIPDMVLHKPGKLTDAESQVMREHPMRSAEMISPFTHVSFFKELIPGILHHHERVDGQGYPHGKTGDEVPLIARVIAVVDTFDAMTRDRAYRKGLPAEVAHSELILFSGRQFDGALVQIFLAWQAHAKKQNSQSKDQDLLPTLLRNAA